MDTQSIVLYFLSLALGAGTVLTAFKLTKTYRSGYLTAYLHFLICFNILAFLKLILTYFAPRLVGATFNETIADLHTLLLFLIFPLIPMCIYFFNKFVFGFFGNQISKPVKVAYLLFWLAVCTGFVVGIKLKLERVNPEFLKLTFLVYLAAVILFLTLSLIRSLFMAKNSPDGERRKAFKNFGLIYTACFFLYGAVFVLFSNPYSGSPAEYLILFSLHLPPIIYLGSFLKNYHLTHPVDRRSTPDWESFAAHHGISPREVEIIRLLIAGKSNRDIEEELFISIKTVKNHIFNIYRKTKIKNRIQLINLVHNFHDEK